MERGVEVVVYQRQHGHKAALRLKQFLKDVLLLFICVRGLDGLGGEGGKTPSVVTHCIYMYVSFYMYMSTAVQVKGHITELKASTHWCLVVADGVVDRLISVAIGVLLGIQLPHIRIEAIPAINSNTG